MSLPIPNPSWRKPAGALAILAWIATFSIAAVTLAPTHAPMVLQLGYYLLAGLIWISPLGPLLRWIQTGKWRA